MAIASNDAKLLLNLASYAREQLHIELMKAISDQDLERVETILSIVPLGILDFINYPPDNGAPGGANPYLFPLFIALRKVISPTLTGVAYTPTSIAIVRALLQAGANINDIRVFRGLASDLHKASPSQKPLLSEFTTPSSQMAAASAEAGAAVPSPSSVTTANENENRKNFIGFLIDSGFNIDIVGKINDGNNLTSLRQILEEKHSPNLLSFINTFIDNYIQTQKEALAPHLGTHKGGGPETIVRQYTGGSIEAPFFSQQGVDVKAIRDTQTLESLGERPGGELAVQADQTAQAVPAAPDSFLDTPAIDPTSLRLRFTPTGDELRLKEVLDAIPHATALLHRLAPYARKKLHTDLILAIRDLNPAHVNKILKTVPLETSEETRRLLDFINYPPVETSENFPLFFPLTFAIRQVIAPNPMITPTNPGAYARASIAIVSDLLRAGADINNIRVFRTLVENLYKPPFDQKPLFGEITEPSQIAAAASADPEAATAQPSVYRSDEESRKDFIGLLINANLNVDFEGKMYFEVRITDRDYLVALDDSKTTNLRHILETQNSQNLLVLIDQFRKNYKAAHQDLKALRDTGTLSASASATAATTLPASDEPSGLLTQRNLDKLKKQREAEAQDKDKDKENKGTQPPQSKPH